MNTYPKNVKVDENNNKNIYKGIYGHRFHKDQTFYEYLIEFLLIFVSAKNNRNENEMEFHTLVEDGKKLEYYVKPRMGLRRFIFFERGMQSKNIPEDREAYEELCNILKEKIDGISDKDLFLEKIQDLLHGYAAVIKNRRWCEQMLLPVCPELVFCEAMPDDKKRINNFKSEDKKTSGNKMKIVDSFEFKKHNFLARGGEVYYLHILQELEKREDKYRIELEGKLKHFLCNDSKKISSIANWIQDNWDLSCSDRDDKIVKLAMGYIPSDAYKESAKYTVDELNTFLSNQLTPMNRIELLACGINLQIMRMMSEATHKYMNKGKNCWIVDISKEKEMRKIAVANFDENIDMFMEAINKEYENYMNENDINDRMEEIKLYNDGRKHIIDNFKARGKELKVIIPSNGKYERFSLSEDVVKFLVLSIIEPNSKMTLDKFLEEIYNHYGFVIGPNEFAKCNKMDISLKNYFLKNKEAFREFIKNIGFLKDLSDATALVENPYQEVENL
ncbi:MAG: hypothetical protein K6G26_11215 [Lachnospiraceae bacterium]|nr:hypothetical protein [Lachnospiraceae bacterium]